MYKKITLKKLSFFFIFLLVLVVLIVLTDQKKGKRSFRTDLMETDTSEITAITIHSKGNQNTPLTLIKEKHDWLLQDKDKQYAADEGMVNEILRTLNDLKTIRIAATDKAKWNDFEVSDSLSTKVMVKKGRKKASTLYIGKFTYQMPKNTNPYDYYNQQPKISTFVRIDDEDCVYVVEGLLSMVFNRDARDYRNKVIMNSDHHDWNRLTFTYPSDSSFVLIKNNGSWTVDGTVIDSTSADEYLNSIARVYSEDFVDDRKPLSVKPDYSLKIEGDNKVKPVTISAFAADTSQGYLISSTLNEGIYFNGKKSGITDRIFISKKWFGKPHN